MFILGFDTVLVGLARVSTEDQNLNLQKDALLAAGCGRIFEETLSGKRFDRPALQECLDYLRPGDVLVVWRLDRLGRSLKNLIEIVENLQSMDIHFKSLTEGFDTTTPGGNFIFQVFGALSEFERNLIRERTQAGLNAARARGRIGGRPIALSPEQVDVGIALATSSAWSVTAICYHLKISRSTYYRHIHPKI